MKIDSKAKVSRLHLLKRQTKVISRHRRRRNLDDVAFQYALAQLGNV